MSEMRMVEPPAKAKKVVAIAYNGLCTFEYAIAVEVFSLKRPEIAGAWYDFRAICVDEGELFSQGGLKFTGEVDFAAIENADLVIIPGWKSPETLIPNALKSALIKAYENGATLASICSGAFVIAQTGLLKGKKCATHWRYAEKMAQLHPSVTMDDKVLYIQEGRIFTSAGSAAGLDLMLHIVERDYGKDAANKVAKRLVFPLRRSGGQAQFIERPIAQAKKHSMSNLFEAIAKNPNEVWNIDRMAKFCAMSKRTFIRRFENLTNQSPIEWLIEFRLDYAKQLLRNSNRDMDFIAQSSGFGSADNLRHHFKRRELLSPSEYRHRV